MQDFESGMEFRPYVVTEGQPITTGQAVEFLCRIEHPELKLS